MKHYWASSYVRRWKCVQGVEADWLHHMVHHQAHASYMWAAQVCRASPGSSSRPKGWWPGGIIKLRPLSLSALLKPLKSTYISARPQEEGGFEAEAKLLADDDRVLHGPGARTVREPKTLQANLGMSVRSRKISISRILVTNVELRTTVCMYVGVSCVRKISEKVRT